jgi:hypothetical protein
VSVEGQRGINTFVPVRYMVVLSRADIFMGGKAAGGPRSISDGEAEVSSGVWNRLGW